MNDFNENQNSALGSGTVCPSCGNEIPIGSAFCQYCGKAAEKLCPNCGAPVSGNFCTNCGADLSAYYTQAAASEAAAAFEPSPAAAPAYPNIPAEAPVKKKGKKKVFIIVGILLFVVVILAVAAVIGYKPLMAYLDNKDAYEAAEALYEDGSYEEAMAAFKALGDYSDSAEKAEECNQALYQEALDSAVELYNDKDYKAAIKGFKKADSIIDTDEADEWLEKCYSDVYEYAEEQYESENYTEAKEYFEMISGYKDADEMAADAADGEVYLSAVDSYNNGNYEEALELFESVSGYRDAGDYIEECNKQAVFGECIQAYTDYINDVEAYEEGHNFAFIYVDNDEIPELYVEGKFEAEGDRICSFYDGDVSEQPLNRIGGMEYIQNSGLIANLNGNMGYYYLDVYYLSEGEFEEIAYGLMYEGEYDEIADEFVYSYEWEGESVSEDEFLENLDNVFDLDLSESVFYTYTADEAISYLNTEF